MTHEQICHAKSDEASSAAEIRGSAAIRDGIVQDVVPKLNHGNDSDEGSDRLAGRHTFIIGADDGIGQIVAIALVREGADVNGANHQP